MLPRPRLGGHSLLSHPNGQQPPAARFVALVAAGLGGGLGLARAANLGDDYAVCGPTHGSAPKYDGQYKVNPMAMLLTVKLMFDGLGENEAAQRLENAVASVIRDGKVGTYDVGLGNTTLEVAEEVARTVNS